MTSKTVSVPPDLLAHVSTTRPTAAVARASSNVLGN